MDTQVNLSRYRIFNGIELEEGWIFSSSFRKRKWEQIKMAILPTSISRSKWINFKEHYDKTQSIFINK